MDLDQVLARYRTLPPAQQNALMKEVMGATKRMKWIPNPGPQTDAYYSKADVLLYGGEPGGGKSQLILGLAFNEHKRSLIMRRQYGDLDRLIEDALKIHGSRDGFNGSPPPKLKLSEEQTIRFGAAARIGDEQNFMGQGQDLFGFDEATHFAKQQIRFMMGWMRSEDPKQRKRVVMATNPPLDAVGLWVIEMFSPWLDPTYPNPAKHGELRWVISDADGNDLWVNGPDDKRTINGRVMHPTSRTYIPASVKDNPNYAAGDYQRTLDAMPEPYRSLLLGGFRTAFKDRDWQVIPTAWIQAAQARWTPEGHKGFAMTAMALDPAGGGRDSAELARRYGGWYAELISAKGEETADGSQTAGTVIRHRRHNSPIVIDVGGGYGGAVILRLRDNGLTAAVMPFNGAGASTARTKDGQLRFANLRAEAWFRFREELDPDQEGGSAICLPPDPELLSDLAAPTWELKSNGILIESKDDIRERLGRSPGKGDAVVMCLSHGNKAAMRMQSVGGMSGSRPTVVMGRRAQLISRR